jgi:hypothetical protein
MVGRRLNGLPLCIQPVSGLGAAPATTGALLDHPGQGLVLVVVIPLQEMRVRDAVRYAVVQFQAEPVLCGYPFPRVRMFPCEFTWMQAEKISENSPPVQSSLSNHSLSSSGLMTGSMTLATTRAVGYVSTLKPGF